MNDDDVLLFQQRLRLFNQTFNNLCGAVNNIPPFVPPPPTYYNYGGMFNECCCNNATFSDGDPNIIDVEGKIIEEE